MFGFTARAGTAAHRTGAAGVLVLALALGGCDDKLSVDNDTTPPTATISGPADGSGVSGVSFLIEVDASDENGIYRVEFRVNGSTITDRTAPFAARVLTLNLAEDDALDVEIEAFDWADNSTVANATYTVRARTVTRLTDAPNDDMNPAWSPDGMRIAFQAKRDGDQFDIWSMDPDGANATRLTQNVNEDRNPAYSPDGQYIAFDSDRAGTFDLWVMPVATGEPGATDVTFGNRTDMQPAWGPNSTYLYFASDRGSNAPFNIWRIPMSGSDADADQLTAFADDDTAPAVSPDGSYLAFASGLNFSSPTIYTMAVGQTEVAPLTGDAGFSEADPAWIPGSGLIMFSRDDGVDQNLWFQAMGEESIPQQGTFGAGVVGDGGAAWSPDGSRLAFHSDRDGNLEIYVLD